MSSLCPPDISLACRSPFLLIHIEAVKCWLRQTVVLLHTVLLNHSPVYEWRLFTWEEYNWGYSQTSVHFLDSCHEGWKLCSWILVCHTLHLASHTSSESGAKRAAMILAYISQFSPVSLIFFTGALVRLYKALRAHVCHRGCNHKLEASRSLIQRTTLML